MALSRARVCRYLIAVCVADNSDRSLLAVYIRHVHSHIHDIIRPDHQDWVNVLMHSRPYRLYFVNNTLNTPLVQ